MEGAELPGCINLMDKGNAGGWMGSSYLFFKGVVYADILLICEGCIRHAYGSRQCFLFLYGALFSLRTRLLSRWRDGMNE